MLRVFAVGLVGALVLLFAYFPSSYRAEQFMEFVRIEHRWNDAVWGEENDEILSRAQRIYAVTLRPPVPGDFRDPAERPVGAGFQTVPTKLANNSYVRSFDAMLFVGSYRMATLWAFFPLVFPLIVVFAFDGLVEREVRSREFGHHSPVVFGVFAGGILVIVMACLVVFFLPSAIHPVVLATVPILLAICTGRAFANYHRAA